MSLDLDDLLASVGGHVRPVHEEAHRPEIINALQAANLIEPGMTLPDVFAHVWKEESYGEIAVRLSHEPHSEMAADVRTWLLAEGWYFRDGPRGRCWFPAEFDSTAWLLAEAEKGDAHNDDT